MILGIICLNLLILVFIYIRLRKCPKNEQYLTLKDLERKIELVGDLRTLTRGPTKHLLNLLNRKRYLYMSDRKSSVIEPYLTLRDLRLRRTKSTDLDDSDEDDTGPTKHLLNLIDRRRYLYMSAHKTGISTR